MMNRGGSFSGDRSGDDSLTLTNDERKWRRKP
jgi:hypothetical protein